MQKMYQKLGLVNTTELFKKAISGKYAIPAYNFNNLEQLQAIIEAAVETQSPVILGITESALDYIDKSILPFLVEGAVKYAIKLNKGNSIPIVLHLDHGHGFEICKECVDLGFSSVMIDGSMLPYSENVSITKKVVEYAHKFNVSVEGELGILAGIEDNVEAAKSIYTNPEYVVDFVRVTGVDSLAISIGTSHGPNKFKPEQCRFVNGVPIPPPLRFDILEEIEKQLPGFPIVLHGSSSIPLELITIINENGGDIKNAIGIPEEQLRNASASSVCKINIDADGRLAITASIRKIFMNSPAEFNPRNYLGPARIQMKKIYKQKIETLFGSNNTI